MCGIAGLVDANELDAEWRSDLRALARSIRHRGPDDHGYYASTHEQETPARFTVPIADAAQRPRVAFAHQRLSILDLSEAARQPMVRADGNVFLTYNGEVYNFRELRAELEAEGATFRTSSDTEVVLEGYLRWGIAVVTRLRGIFAFAIADLRIGKVFLVRDHLGVKPLYYATLGTTVVFNSELKAIADLPRFRRAVDPEAIRTYLHYLWIPGERSGLAGVQKLAPGSWMEIDLASGSRTVHRFWSPLDRALVDRSRQSLDEMREHLLQELGRVVREQMVSDVPLGAFLSGGLDSSLIVAQMSTSGRSAATYSVGYSRDDLAYDIVPDDTPFARQVSQQFKTRSTEILLSPDVEALLPRVVETLDEPLGDPAAMSSYLICREAKRSLTVMLSGMGADEIFGGYPRQRALVYGTWFRRFPRWIRSGVASAVELLPGAGKGPAARLGRAGKKFLANVESDPLSHYISMETYFADDAQQSLLAPGGALATVPCPVVRDAIELRREIASVAGDDSLKQAILWDQLTYLPSLNLAYTDRTSMAHGVEVRVPFLDVRLVEWAIGLHASDLVGRRRGRLEGKWLLKKAAERQLPDSIVWRRKAGFGAPVRAWLRAPLTEMREELLGPRGLGARSWFSPGALRRLQDDFLSGRNDFSLQIWMLMSLELWARRFIDARNSSNVEENLA